MSPQPDEAYVEHHVDRLPAPLAGQPVTFTATASCFSAGETTTFLDGTASIGTGALNASGVATLTTSSLSGGQHLITASYPGDTNCLPGDSAPLTQTVNGARMGIGSLLLRSGATRAASI
jgi:hypothetical protein